MNTTDDFYINIPNIGSHLIDFEILTELGRGAYGIVNKVKSLIDQNLYVIKMMDLKHMKEKQQKECWKEAMILKKIHHPSIIKYYSSFLEDEKLYIVMEFAEGGDLYSLIKQNKKHNKTFPEEELWRFTYDIVIGMEYLHSNKIIHRDIKCLNLFMTKDRRIKIGDLGVSKIVSSMDALQCTRVGTPLYLSPEQIKQVPYDCKVDMWSVGCSLYHLACLDPPFRGDNLIILGNNIVKSKQRPISNIYSKSFAELIEKLLSKKSENRPTAIDALTYVPKYIVDELQFVNDRLIAHLKGIQKNLNEEKLGEINPKKTPTKPLPVNDNKLTPVLKEVNYSNAIEIKKENNFKLEILNNALSAQCKDIKRENYTGSMTPSNSTSNNVNIFLKQNRLSMMKNSLIKNKDDNTSRVVNNFNLPITKIAKDYNHISSISEIKILESFENIPNTNQLKHSEKTKPKASTKELKDLNIQDNNLLHKVENFQINIDTKLKENNKAQPKQNKIDDIFLIEEDIEIREENSKLIDKKFFLNKNQIINKPSEEENLITKRLNSAKLRTPSKFRPNTASYNKILIGNNNDLNETRENKQKVNIRPFTAINRTEEKAPELGSQINTTENKNVINININFYNVDMNKRFINPAVQSSLIHINKSLFPNENKVKPVQSECSKERRRNKSTNPPLTGRSSINPNSHQLVFHKILRSIESQLR